MDPRVLRALSALDRPDVSRGVVRLPRDRDRGLPRLPAPLVRPLLLRAAVPGRRAGLTVDARPSSTALLRRAFDANLRYYEALGELTLDYIRTLRSLSDGAAPAIGRFTADAMSDVVARATAAAQP